MRPGTLRDVEEFPAVDEATSISYGRGAIWIADVTTSELVGVLSATREKLGPYKIGSDAQHILYVEPYLWLLHRAQSCLRRFDFGQNSEVGRGVPVGPFAWRMTHRGGQSPYPTTWMDPSWSWTPPPRRRLGHPFSWTPSIHGLQPQMSAVDWWLLMPAAPT